MIRLALTVWLTNLACQIAGVPTLTAADWLLMCGLTVAAALFLTHLLIDPPHYLRRFRL